MSNIDEECRIHGGEVVKVLADMPVSKWGEKSALQKGKSVLQSVHNYHIKHALHLLSWTLEPYVSEGGNSLRRSDFSKGSSRKKTIVEVEFGNTARMDSAHVKFLTAHHEGTLEVAIFVVAANSLAKETDSGLATFEAAVQYFKNLPPAMMPYPLVIIGLAADSSTPVLDWFQSRFTDPRQLSGNGGSVVLSHVVSELHEGVVLEDVGPPATPAELQEAKALSKRLNSAKASEIGLLAMPPSLAPVEFAASAQLGSGDAEQEPLGLWARLRNFLSLPNAKELRLQVA